MSPKTASRQAAEAILRFPASAHDGPQKLRDETKKYPRFWCAWTLCENGRQLLAVNNSPVDLFAERPVPGEFQPSRIRVLIFLLLHRGKENREWRDERRYRFWVRANRRDPALDLGNQPTAKAARGYTRARIPGHT